MSHTTRILKEIASTEEYQSLSSAVEQGDYEAMFGNYTVILERLKGGKGSIEESIENLPLQNKDEHRDKFSRAFEQAIERILPVWSQVNQRLVAGLSNRGVMEGEVFAFGKKGDPLVKTPEGTIVVLSGAKLEQGDRVKFRVVQEAPKLKFGRTFEVNQQNFYFLLTHEARDAIRESLSYIRDRIRTSTADSEQDSTSELADLLQRLDEIEKLSSTLQVDERERIHAQANSYRSRLVVRAAIGMMFDFISQQEEEDIRGFYQDGNLERERALSALGLFRRQTYEGTAGKLLAGEKPEGYEGVLSEMKENVDSMDSAMQFMEFESAIDEVLPRAKRYMERMDRMFSRLAGRARQVAEGLSNSGVIDPEQINLAIQEAFGEDVRLGELSRVFRTSKEFVSLRGSLMELNRKLKDEESLLAETTFKPYLQQKILQAFGS